MKVNLVLDLLKLSIQMENKLNKCIRGTWRQKIEK